MALLRLERILKDNLECVSVPTSETEPVEYVLKDFDELVDRGRRRDDHEL